MYQVDLSTHDAPRIQTIGTYHSRRWWRHRQDHETEVCAATMKTTTTMMMWDDAADVGG